MQSKVYVTRRGAIDSDRSVSVAGRSNQVWHNCDDHPPVAEIQCFGIFHMPLIATLILTYLNYTPLIRFLPIGQILLAVFRPLDRLIGICCFGLRRFIQA